MGKKDRLAIVSAELSDEDRDLVADFAIALKRMSRRSRRDVGFFAEAKRRRTEALLVLEIKEGSTATTATFIGRRLPPHLIEVVAN